ncbi:hypothetical protein [Streptomyces sp.]|uniref:hypothetical protein n=1 Tax=Streptomyces sp. TaxID=1931 RepID=UPI002D2B88CF|nr:hypothetical protein [Streptomyces sp.]HZF92367.1 hypothetical protein [Streptomyces sp.]
MRLTDRVSQAKVHKSGKHRHEAEVSAEGTEYGTLRTQGKAATHSTTASHGPPAGHAGSARRPSARE